MTTDAAVSETDGKPGPADLIEIFYAPKAVFERRRQGEFGMPLLVLFAAALLITLATSSLMQPIWEAMVAKSLAAQPNLTPDQAAAGRTWGVRLSMIGIVVSFAVIPFVLGLTIWLVGMIAGIKQTYGVATMIATFAFFPRLIGLIVAAAEAAFVSDPSSATMLSLSISPARFVDATHAPILAAILSRFDLFALWSTCLIAIGLAVAARADRAKAWITAIAVWVIAAIPAIFGVLRAAK